MIGLGRAVTLESASPDAITRARRAWEATPASSLTAEAHRPGEATPASSQTIPVATIPTRPVWRASVARQR